MALSNIFNEPRREIVEQIVGMTAVAVVVGGYGFAVYHLAMHFHDSHPERDFDLQVAASILILASFALVTVIFIILTHAVGDRICNALQARGIHLRPRERRNAR